jgi:hypothetical protein
VADETSPDAAEQDIGALENETIFIPGDGDVVAEDHAEMRMGDGPDNDLRDPFFRTDAGTAWLDEHERAATQGGGL